MAIVDLGEVFPLAWVRHTVQNQADAFDCGKAITMEGNNHDVGHSHEHDERLDAVVIKPETLVTIHVRELVEIKRRPRQQWHVHVLEEPCAQSNLPCALSTTSLTQTQKQLRVCYA